MLLGDGDVGLPDWCTGSNYLCLLGGRSLISIHVQDTECRLGIYPRFCVVNEDGFGLLLLWASIQNRLISDRAQNQEGVRITPPFLCASVDTHGLQALPAL